MEHTSLFLNGPKLGIVTNPQDVIDVVGIATFTGIATASFLTSSDGINDGSIELKWYYDGSQILDSSEDSTSNASIVGFTSALGYGSTITISGFDRDDNGKEIYFMADYVPTAYSQPIGTTVTAGTARSTGNAYNELLKSEIATITVYPYIEITSQPEDVTTVGGQTATYSVDARKYPGGGDVSFQWQFDNEDLSDGTISSAVDNSIAPASTITITGDNGSSASVDSSKLSAYDGFVTGVTYTITASNDVTTKCYAVGGGGGASDVGKMLGGAAGSASGTFTFLKDKVYKVRVGGLGKDGDEGGAGGYSGGGNGGAGLGKGGGGGGYTGLFINSISKSNAILIAGGGGGGANDPAAGGAGGGLVGERGGNASEAGTSRGGRGGTQSGGGSGGNDGPVTGSAGSDLAGGSGAAGGGGGYYGGGGGVEQTAVPGADGAGGGGSSFLHSTLISDGETTTGNWDDQPRADGSFRFEIVNVTETTTITRTISGSKTKTLSITVTSSGKESSIGSIRCKVTADGVQKSPVYSRSASWVVIHRNLLKYEVVNEETAVLSHVGEHNLDDEGQFSLSYGDFEAGNLMSLNHNSSLYPRNQLIIVYPPEKDIPVTITIAGAEGAKNTNRGGPGGISQFDFTLKSSTEYVFLLGPSGLVPSPGGGYGGGGGTFFYRGSQLIACVGGGGGGGPCGVGGNGGAMSVNGTNGTGGAAGVAGIAPEDGSLSARGFFPGGSETSYTPYGRTETAMDGGRVSACTWGSWYIERAYSPCSDIGVTYFRGNDGTENTSTAQIKRSYKPGPGGGSAEEGERGWIYRFNGGNGGWGASVGYNGDGGGGATGGQGGHRSHSGGGGGSGYSNGEPLNSTIITPLNSGSGYFKIELSISFEDVIFTQTKTSDENVYIQMALKSGGGPSTILLGSRPASSTTMSSSVTSSIQKGSIYELKEHNGNTFSLSGNSISLIDSDTIPGTLTVTPDKGSWTLDTSATETSKILLYTFE